MIGPSGYGFEYIKRYINTAINQDGGNLSSVSCRARFCFLYALKLLKAEVEFIRRVLLLWQYAGNP